jgi:acetyl-CoA carboxylase biotin carboxyl carrier protein
VDFKEIKRIVELMDEYGLTHFKLEQDESKLELSKKSEIDTDAMQRLMASIPASAPSAPQAAPPPPHPSNTFGGDDADTSGDGPPPGEVEITSVLVGTFYMAPSPDAEPFVKVGSVVEEDTQVCVIEAMKVMNAITAGVKGTITKVLVENGTPVMYGEPLFNVKPA